MTFRFEMVNLPEATEEDSSVPQSELPGSHTRVESDISRIEVNHYTMMMIMTLNSEDAEGLAIFMVPFEPEFA
jgi:hypothetical protein